MKYIVCFSFLIKMKCSDASFGFGQRNLIKEPNEKVSTIANIWIKKKEREIHPHSIDK